jgi:hypothetical protein
VGKNALDLLYVKDGLHGWHCLLQARSSSLRGRLCSHCNGPAALAAESLLRNGCPRASACTALHRLVLTEGRHCDLLLRKQVKQITSTTLLVDNGHKSGEFESGLCNRHSLGDERELVHSGNTSSAWPVRRLHGPISDAKKAL